MERWEKRARSKPIRRKVLLLLMPVEAEADLTAGRP
jgi:hypothetical protein